MTGGKAPRAAGDRFERLCIERLRAHDYLVIRSAGSLGPADIWAARADRGLLLISCKVTDKTTVAERCAFLALAVDAGALALIATKTGRGRMQFVRIHGPNGLRDPYDIGNSHG
jgi:Holliday junction resolvase